MATADAPQAAEDELELIVRIIVEDFERAVFGATSQWRRSARLLAIILFGDHVGGPASPGHRGETSDRQILVVVNDERLTDLHQYWSGAEERLDRAHTVLGRLGAPTNLLVRSVKYVNDQLERGRPFFKRVVEAGVRLYEAPGCSFSQSREMEANADFREARAYFQMWIGAADRRLKIFRIEQAEGRHDPLWRRDAAFTLHQAVERLYGCLLLTLERYSPATHQIGALRSLAEQVEPRLVEAWPRATKEERRAFELLRQAYIRGRYAPDFRITEDELAWLVGKVAVLRTLVSLACEEFLARAGATSPSARSGA